MMNKYIATFLLFILSVFTAVGQTPAANNASTDDKFFVVGMVLTIIFIGIVVYLVVLDRKISKLEKQQSRKKD
jgi:CcmD family protein